MSYLYEAVRHATLIESVLRQTIIFSVHEAWKRTAPNKPQEPDIVAALVADGEGEIGMEPEIFRRPQWQPKRSTTVARGNVAESGNQSA